MKNIVNELHAEGFLELPQIIGDRKANPPIIGVFPIGQAYWYIGMKSGIYPKPIKIGRRSLWRVSDIRDLLAKLSAGESK